MHGPPDAKTSRHQRPSALLVPALVDFEHEMRPVAVQPTRLVLNRALRGDGVRGAAESDAGSARGVHRPRPDAVGRRDRTRCRRRHRLFPGRAAQPCAPDQAGRCRRFLARRRCVRRRPDRAGVPCAMAGRCRHHGRDHRGESVRRPQSLERRSLCPMQCGRSRAHGLAH